MAGTARPTHNNVICPKKGVFYMLVNDIWSKKNRLLYGPVPAITHAGVDKSGAVSLSHSVCLVDVAKDMISRTDM